MSIESLNPYLILDGTAAEAIRLYELALGAKVEGIMRYSEMPGEKPPAAYADRIVHAMLVVGGGSIMVSDAGPGSTVAKETNVHVCLQFTEVADLKQRFAALAEGGTVTMPLADTFWGAHFGMLTDRFGIRWMFNAQLEPAKA